MLVGPKKNSKGIILMLISMASFAVGDTFVKISGAFLSPAQIMFFLIAGGLIIFAIIAKFKGENLLDRRAFSSVLLIRYCAEMVGLVAMIIGLTKIPLSVVGTVTQASPILVAAGAVVSFYNSLGVFKWRKIFSSRNGLGSSFQHDNFGIFWLSFAHNIFAVRRTFSDNALQIFAHCISANFRFFGFRRTPNSFNVNRCHFNLNIWRVHNVARKSGQKWSK